MDLTLITAPTAEPLTSTEAKLQCKVDVSADDALFTILIAAARERAELATGRSLVSQTWDMELDRFPDQPYIEIPKPPLQSVTSLKYRDTAGTQQTWAASNYVVTGEQALPVLNARQPCGRISLAYGIVWPSLYGQAGDVIVRFVSGYGAATAVPSLLKAAMLLDITSLYTHRSDVVMGNVAAIRMPGGARDIYRSYRAHLTQRQAA